MFKKEALIMAAMVGVFLAMVLVGLLVVSVL
jgi:hypothetical protein